MADSNTHADQTTRADADAFVFGVDLDGVCADYVTSFRTIVAAELGVDVETIGEQTDWRFHQVPSWGIRDADHFSELHHKAVTEHGMFATMAEIDGASDALWELSDAGVYIRIITHRLTTNWGHSQAVADTVTWLQTPRDDGRPRIPYRDICFVAQKAEVGADLYVDDAPHNVALLRRARRDVICFDAPYNRTVKGKRAASWDDVKRHVYTAVDELGLRAD